MIFSLLFYYSASAHEGKSQTKNIFQVTSPSPLMVLSPDPGFPMWLTPDVDSYLPLQADQTSGLDWIASEPLPNGEIRDWMIAVDDSDIGRIHIFNVTGNDLRSSIEFAESDMTLAPPSVAGFNFAKNHGYDWESIALHPWSGSIFLMHEGALSEMGLYVGRLSFNTDQIDASAGSKGDRLNSLPRYIFNIRKINLPGWNETFGGLFKDNLGIEGIACSSDRLFIGLESPFDFTQRLLEKKSTIFAVWEINSEDPSDMSECRLLSVHDTSQWESTLGVIPETICGLDALDNNRVVGVDRDNSVIFSIRLDDSGNLVGGRAFFLDLPGPAPLSSDNCPDLEGMPKLKKPSLESIAVIPRERESSQFEYCIYAVVDPWAPGWALMGTEWRCPCYEKKLNSLLPAIYRFTVLGADLFG